MATRKKFSPARKPKHQPGVKGQRGGAQPGSGKKPKATAFRQWCRSVIDDPEVRKAVIARAKADPEFALRVAEHGYGRPPASLQVNTPLGSGQGFAFICTFADGDAYPAAAVPVPEGAAGED